MGAGPAGLSAAINLAKEGFQVDVYERNNDVGKRFNGDIQGLENWTKKENILKSFKKMNINSNFNYTPFKKLTLSNIKKYWNFNLDKPAFYLIKRGSMTGSLDHGLKEQAKDIGVNIHFNETIPEDSADIIATGPRPEEIFAAARTIVFETHSENRALAVVNKNIALNGYSYLLVADGWGTISTVLFNKFHQLNDCFHKSHKFFLGKIDNIFNIIDSGGVGCFSNQNIFQKDGIYYTGEAAGIQDFLWGFGIRSAVTSGYLAAKAIIDNGDYEMMAGHEFKNKLRAGVVNRFLWELSGDYSQIVNRIHHSSDPLVYLRSFHNFNKLQRLLYPLALYSMKRRYRKLKL